MRPAPHQSFPSAVIGEWQPNRLVFNIQPAEGILIRFQAKQPGLNMRLGPEDMRFTYKEALAILEKRAKSPHVELLERMVELCQILKRI